MKTTTRRLLGGLAIALLTLASGGSVLAASPSPAGSPPSGPTGSEMLSVQPSIIGLAARPGSTSTVDLTLRAAANLNVTIKSQGLAQGTDGSFKAVPAEGDTSQYSARSMLSASPEALQVKPGDTVKVTVNVAVPEGVGEGTRYAILTITGMPEAPSGSSNVGFGVELGVSAIVQIAGTTQAKTGEIQTIDIGAALPGQALPVNVSFLNTGNAHYGAIPNELVTSATLQDDAGTVLATAGANGNQLSVIPTFSRTVGVSMTPSSPLVPDGRYHLEVGVGLKDGTILDRKALDFTWSGGEVLGATSAPVQQPATVAPPTDTTLIIIIAALLGAAVALALLLVLTRVRRRPSLAGGTPGK